MTKDRKQALLQLLKEAPKALNGKNLAEHFHVTRQVIVQDIAILRADGAPILSTNRGYIYKQIETNPYVHKLFKVKHEVEEIGQELLAIVDNGGRVQNTLIDHPVYGEIETLLKLSCRRDVQHFLEQVEHSDFRPLSELTDGIHYHLVEAETQQGRNTTRPPLYRGGLGSARLFGKGLENFLFPIVFCTARVEKFRFVRSFHHLHQG